MWLSLPRFCSKQQLTGTAGTNFISVMPSFDPVPLSMSLVATPVRVTDWKRELQRGGVGLRCVVALALGWRRGRVG
jgi:hypothetical protein